MPQRSGKISKVALRLQEEMMSGSQMSEEMYSEYCIRKIMDLPGRKIAYYLAENFTKPKSYLREGLRKIVEMWVQLHDEHGDVEIPQGMTKEQVYDADIKRFWQLGWQLFKENCWQRKLEDAKKTVEHGFLDEDWLLWYTTTDLVFKELEEEIITMDQIMEKNKEMVDLRDKLAKKEPTDEETKDEDALMSSQDTEKDDEARSAMERWAVEG